jgi:hypothetical protein
MVIEQQVIQLFSVTANDTDEPKTVADRVADDKKARLLRYFNYGVMAYMVSWFAATLLPLFLYSPGQEDTAVRVMLMLENLARWAFLAVLCWVFRCAIFPVLHCHAQGLQAKRISRLGAYSGPRHMHMKNVV